MTKKKLLDRILPLLPLIAAAIALWLLRGQLEAQSLDEIIESAREVPLSRIAVGVFLVAAAFLVLTLYDALALRSVGSEVPYRRSAPISCIAYGIGNALGYPIFTSMPLRFRLLRAAGSSATQVIQMVTITMFSFWVGLLALCGLLLLIAGGSISDAMELPLPVMYLFGLAGLTFTLAFVLFCARRTEPIRFREHLIPLPSGARAFGQVGLASADWLLGGLAMWVLLPTSPELSFSTFLGIYLVAQVLALVSHVPGGVGVLEASLIGLLSPWLPAGEVAGTLIVFRCLYYLLPFLLSAMALVAVERATLRAAGSRFQEAASPWLGPVVPRVLGLATFAAGAFLVVTGSMPALPGRLNALAAVVPVGLIASSHLLASVAGVALLILSRGLVRRLDGAWHVTSWMLGFAIVASLLRGLDWEEAGVLLFVWILLLTSRRHFYRRATLMDRPFSPRWILGVALVVVCGLWLGWFAYRDQPLAQDRIWQVSLRNDAPRTARAQVAVASTLFALALLRLFRGARPSVQPPSVEDEARIDEIVESSPRISAKFAYLGDKHFLFDEQRTSFIMYGISGDSWISLGDPVGDPERYENLIWSFREQCDLYDERPVFYQVRPEHLPLYLDAGLAAIKLGEAASVPLQEFSLEGGSRKDLRQSVRRGEREGLTFEVMPRDQVPHVLAELRTISDEWVEDKNASEKSFSLGNFDEAYLSHFPHALVRREGQIVAFANVLLGAGSGEMSVDLMRYRNEAPPGVMDFLFVQLILWAKQEGYREFNMGMAPLAGLDEHALAPAWSRLGSWLFRHGEHFYNFRGLRFYKEKYGPTWQPRYLAAPDGLSMSQALFDVARLISGGVVGLVRK